MTRNKLRLHSISCILTAFLAGVIIFTAACVLPAATYSNRVQGEISSGIIRLHVVANSNLPEDQAVKLRIRDAVLTEVHAWTTGSEGKKEVRAILESRLADIESVAMQFTDLPVKAYLTNDFFPTKAYGDITLPAGGYETLRITVGEGTGRNWWCVLFPPLCFVNSVTEQREDNESPHNIDNLRNIMSAEAYSVVTEPENVKIKFKAVEIWQEIKNLFSKKTD